MFMLRLTPCLFVIGLLGLAGCASTGNGLSQQHLSRQAGADAPAGIQQFGRLVGAWDCTVQQRQADGSWLTTPGTARWDWFYALGGHAILDMWVPASAPQQTAGLGANLRIFNTQTGQWQVAWTTAAQQRFDLITAAANGSDMVMRSTKPGSNGRPGHLARITFYNIDAQQFDWRYDASPLGDGINWTAYVQMRCLRQ